jgi:hypothetical protein
MATGSKSVTVMDCRCGSHDMEGKDFKVKSATNIITYQMDQYITENQVDDLIRNGVRVSVVPYR